MNRREMLKSSLWAALPVLPQHEHHQQPQKPAAGAKASAAPATLKFFTAEQNRFVTQLAELIIPQTDTPGARAARVNLYIDQLLAASDDAAKKAFLDGLKWLDQRAMQQHRVPFLRLSEAQQVAILEPLATGRNFAPADQPGVRFFNRVKELTITGYYTSADGFVSELGFSSGFTGAYPGCTHPEHKE